MGSETAAATDNDDLDPFLMAVTRKFDGSFGSDNGSIYKSTSLEISIVGK